MAIHIDEFLYRGRPEGSAVPPAWHVKLVSLGTDDFGEPTRTEKTLSMAQAVEAGFDLPGILAAINAELLADLDRKNAEIADLAARLDEKDAEIRQKVKEALAGAA